ncbi:Abhydrolase domain-containing protein 12 [Intoshia linei]|uniref:Abhydrolase domain-containing protein 12 n=1 Tax=Intoshia linei TaxID=1819745 RepID=A0A177B9R9_9BILA|nr:Abhydrolase domain-containing protein 12 [Intoshia linei]
MLVLLATLLILVYLTPIFLLFFCPELLKRLVLFNFINRKSDILKNPKEFGLNNTIHSYFETEPGIKLGVWHILPAPLNVENDNFCDEYTRIDYLNSGKGLILYLHGNTNNRGGSERIGTYQKLSEIGYNIVTFDYRGFGDSNGVTTYKNIIFDSLRIYYWLKNMLSDDRKIVIWGHSLGTGVACELSNSIRIRQENVDCLVLESPFTSLYCSAIEHPITTAFLPLKFFMKIIIKRSLSKIEFSFDNKSILKRLKCPILIMHARDDKIIPFYLGENCYCIAKSRECHEKTITIFDDYKSNGFGHKNIHKSHEFQFNIEKFFMVSNISKIE